jgi:hypothetical protein
MLVQMFQSGLLFSYTFLLEDLLHSLKKGMLLVIFFLEVKSSLLNHYLFLIL